MDQFTAQQQQGSPAVSVASQPTTPAPGSSSASSTAAGPVSSASSVATAPGSAPAFQPDEDSRTLYVGNLDQNVNEAALQELFAQAGGAVESVKIIRDKNVSDPRSVMWRHGSRRFICSRGGISCLLCYFYFPRITVPPLSV